MSSEFPPFGIVSTGSRLVLGDLSALELAELGEFERLLWGGGERCDHEIPCIADEIFEVD